MQRLNRKIPKYTVKKKKKEEIEYKVPERKKDGKV